MNSIIRVAFSPLTISYMIMVILLAIGALSLSKHYDKSNRMLRLFRHMFIAAYILSSTAYFGFISPNETMAQAFHSINFVFYDLAIFELYCFVSMYTNDGLIRRWELILVGIPMAYNIVTAFLSIFNKSVISVEVCDAYNNTYYVYTEGPLHWINWTISILVVIGAILKLFMAYASTPFSFRRRYSSITQGILLCLLFNILFLGIGLDIDVSPIFSSLVVVVAYYCAVLHSPSSFIKKIRAMVIDNMSDGIIIMDFAGRLQDDNDAARRILGYDKTNAKEVIDVWLQRNNIDLTGEQSLNIHDEELVNHQYLTVTCHQFRESKTPNMVTATYIQIHDRSEEIKAQEALYYTATHDALTGLLNREAFYEEVEEVLKKAKDFRHYIVCTDIENFKLFNDVFGLKAGDTFLTYISQSLQSCVSGIMCMGRIGADRFAILMDRDRFSEADFAKAFQMALSRMSNTHYAVNAYVGVFEIEDDTTSVASMCDRALVAVQSIKGKADRFAAFYDHALMEQKRNQKALNDELHKAMDDDEFIFYIQPQISANGMVHGGEALVRWNHPTRGILTPYFFINAMEENAMISDLDYKIWSKVCRKLKEWKEAGHEDMYISVNISPKDFYYRDIYATFTELVKRYDIDPGRIKLEITESAIMQNAEEQIHLINRLREAGFTVEMDDFGSGYSSLNMLSQLSVDVLKIDMGFLQRGLADSKTAEVIKLIQNMGKALGMETIVEGVETEEQAEFLKSIGCEMFQGYLYSKPMPIKEFEEKYLK